MKAAEHLLNYAATHPDAAIRYHASDMQLHIHSDASYLSEPEARSRAGGFYFLDGKDRPDDKNYKPKLNGPIYVLSKIICNVMASAAEAEMGGLFMNGQEGTVLRTTLEEMRWKQHGPTPMQTDNSTASGIANDTVKAKRSKAMDMRFHWIKDRVRQGQFRVHWAPGEENLADYPTKHHPPSHHIKMRPTYLHVASTLVPLDTSDGEGVLIQGIPRDSAPAQQSVTECWRERAEPETPSSSQISLSVTR